MTPGVPPPASIRTAPFGTMSTPSPSSPYCCLVVDDDPTARSVMARYVSRHPDLELAGICADADEAKTTLQDEHVDLVILDIEMPGMSGLELADMEIMHGLETRPQVVFVTAKENYAAEAFSVDATDYLVKPVRYGRFEEAIARVNRLRAANAVLAGDTDATSDGDMPLHQGDGMPAQDTSPADDSVFIKVDGRLIRLNLDELMWVEAQGDYMLLTTDSSRYLIHSTMKALSEKLPDSFVRVHRSFIVNLDKVKDIEDTTLVINRKVIPIGASYRDDLLSSLNTL